MFIQAKKRMIPLAPLFMLIMTVSIGAYFYSFTKDVNQDSFGTIAPVIIFYVLSLIFLFAYFVVAFVDYLKPLRGQAAGVTINDLGIDVNLSVFSLGYIPWNNIHGAKIIKTYGTNLVVIYLRNENDILRSQPYWKRYFLQKWKKKWGSPMVISEKRISYDIIALTKSINSRAGTYKS